jgi:HK97 family phage portal protein
MSYLEQLIAQQMTVQPVGADLGLPKGGAYSSYYSPTEVGAPAQNYPSNFQMAMSGYAQNEFAYSIIMTRAMAKSQAPIQVYDNSGEHPEEMMNQNIIEFLNQPNDLIDFSSFIQIKQIFQDIAGFSAWEIECNKIGEPLRLWPMLPHYCSFLRGEQKMIRAIRYQPTQGMPPQDIPIERVLFFTDGEDFHPIYPLNRFLSPMMHAFPQIEIDSAMTFFLNDFVKHGARFAGLLSVAQTIDETTAEDIRRRWRAQHGGTSNWSDPLVLGLGATYQNMQMNFKDMSFPELDARAETRICNAFNIDPIVANARAGLDVSSYNNKNQAETGWFQKWVIPSWKSDARTMNKQLLPLYFNDYKKYYFQFDLTQVYSLREDRNAQVTRAVSMYEKKIARLNEAREEIGLDPIDDVAGEEFYKAPEPVQVFGQQQGDPPKGKVPPALVPFVDKFQAEADATDQETLAANEIKDFRAFAKKRIKENKPADIFEFEFKYVPAEDQDELRARYNILKVDDSAAKVLDGIKAALIAMSEQQPAPQAQPMNITVHSYPQEPPTVNIENKSANITTPAPIVTVVNKVEPTPVNITNAPAAPVVKRKKAKLTKHDDGSIEIEEA